MANVFQNVSVRKPNANTFNLGHDVKYSMQMGNLTPVLLQEVLPGDKFNIRTETLIRFAPLVAPVMHNIKVFTHYFFVPNRILWPNWEDFISADLSKETPPAWPFISTPNKASNTTFKGTLWDYFGLPTGAVGATGTFPSVSAIPFAAYQAIYNEYYRDQNLETEVNYKLVNGSNNATFGAHLSVIRQRAWMHDYFTSALPFAQKGPAVDLPLGGEAEVLRNNEAETGNLSTWTNDITTGQTSVMNGESLDAGVAANQLFVDLETATGATINDLRTAIRLQEFFEKAARGGSRYVEQLLVHWAVRSSDARLNRPEFIGGTRNPVIVSEVLQTSSSDTESPQANMAGHGISVNSGKSFRYYAEEHGYIIGIQSVMPNTAYQQGIPRHFSRESWEDYAWPTFAHLGEQAILNKELYADSTDSLDEETFGYIPRYSEYRYTPSRVCGEFRDTLAFWHLGRIFSNRPTLSSQFVKASTAPNGGIRTDIFAVPSEPQHLWCHSFNKVFVRRKLPKYGTPTI